MVKFHKLCAIYSIYMPLFMAVEEKAFLLSDRVNITFTANDLH